MKLKISFSAPEMDPAYTKLDKTRKLSDVHESVELNMIDMT